MMAGAAVADKSLLVKSTVWCLAQKHSMVLLEGPKCSLKCDGPGWSKSMGRKINHELFPKHAALL